MDFERESVSLKLHDKSRGKGGRGEGGSRRSLKRRQICCCRCDFLTRASELESIWHHLNYLYTQLYLMMIKAANSRSTHTHTHPQTLAVAIRSGYGDIKGNGYKKIIIKWL